MSKILLRPPTPADLPQAEQLLTESDLPAAGVADHWGPGYVVAEWNGNIAGVAGVECHGEHGLLRSVAVRQELRGTGLGARLVEDRLRWAEEQGIRDIFLLTATAATWFPRYGFVSIARAEVPAVVLAAPEFASICPSSAAVLVRRSA